MIIIISRPWVSNLDATAIDAVLKNHPPAPHNTFASRAHQSTYRNVPENSAAAIQIFPKPLAKRITVRNFLIGFGSIIQTASRRKSDPQASDAAPCRISAKFGYLREWNFQASTAKICALGLRRAKPGEKGSTINGVLFRAPDNMEEFDKRENGYMRVPVPQEMVEMLSWQALPSGATVYVYVPYAPNVVQKFGVDKGTNLPLCSGPHLPAGTYITHYKHRSPFFLEVHNNLTLSCVFHPAPSGAGRTRLESSI